MPVPQWRIEHTSWAHILFLDGDVDLVTAPALDEQLQDLVAHGHHVLVDLSAVDYLDMCALESLEQAHRQALDLGRRLLLLRPSIRAQRLLDLGVNGQLQVLPSIEAAAVSMREVS